MINTYVGPTIYTNYEGEKDSDVLVGDGNYTSLCRKCLAKKGIKIRKRVK